MQDNVREALDKAKARQSGKFRPVFDTQPNPSTPTIPSPFKPVELTIPKPIVPPSIYQPTPNTPTSNNPPSDQISSYINRICGIEHGSVTYLNMSPDDQFYHDLLMSLSDEERVEVVRQSLEQGLLSLN